jgi:hypothetical protein
MPEHRPQVIAKIAFFLFLGASARAAGTAAPPPITDRPFFDRIEKSQIFFKTGAAVPKPIVVKSDLFDLRYIGTIAPATGEPYFYFAAKPCENCNADVALHAVRPSQGKVASFVYPGRILEPRTKAVVLDSRAFLGRCLPGYGDVFVVFQKEKVGKKRPHVAPSVYIAEAAPEFLREKLLEKGRPDLNRTLKLVRAKQCHEIDGKNRVSSSISLSGSDRHSGASDASDADDDDDSPGDSPQPGT